MRIYRRSCRAAAVVTADSHANSCSRWRRQRSSSGSSASEGTMKGSAMARATVVNGLGIWVRSQLFSDQCSAASAWNGNHRIPGALDSHTAPGWATRAGPRGPSIVKAVGCSLRVPSPAAASPCGRRATRSARRSEPEPVDDARDPLAVVVLARDDDDAAIAEMKSAVQDAAVPDGVNAVPAGPLRLATGVPRLQPATAAVRPSSRSSGVARLAMAVTSARFFHERCHPEAPPPHRCRAWTTPLHHTPR